MKKEPAAKATPPAKASRFQSLAKSLLAPKPKTTTRQAAELKAAKRKS